MLREKLFKDFLKNKKNLEIRNQLIELHLPLVKKLVYQFKYYPQVLTKEDLYQEGILGLIKALNNYQDLGYDFVTYTTPKIKFAINELIRKSHSPSIPQKTTKHNNISFKEEKYLQPNWDKILNPHQLWLKQVKHELLIKKLKTKLSKNEFNVICLSFGISLENKNEPNQQPLTNHAIAQKLKLTLRQIEKIKNIAIQKISPNNKDNYKNKENKKC
ncbi:MAG: sigma-70 family RNA polymerase sigma factor [Candidatus Phytoplasma asteris]|uniref:DNA-directed RNA polymerase specialized sigma subunit n=1 Tax='Chrysanthemum coronarium' phytoplasma TaxID=1520703 RepID=A0ABQ0J2S1_9MOLU|nr:MULTISPECIES: sigma-70 family RNA polymerase sigma factor [Phytoplasma]OIJ44665.1 RNA polymerase subunit sigma-70 [Rice orange leaf phytoplasma]TKA87844.1 MAG: DNA-directed RNA polymerase sigma-70 factor [Periwinkle leaf yellowing phytoplasma]WEX19769.1 MAG: sigma-70 family RNA polymerase sigma factor [Candidatus Phytoplasma asteris]GAK73849.1 DNA-directed RNA polymerase specialized sigma subunit ['Chrysanthemum coronarium' phytoplasma]